MHIESKNQNTKRRMETENIPFFFLINQCYMANSMKKASSISKDSNNLSKPHFGCYNNQINFRHSLVNFKNVIILFLEHMDYLWFVKKLKKYCVGFGTCKK